MYEPLTLIMPFYQNRHMLERQLEHLAGLPKAVKQALHVIIVDDGSPQPETAQESIVDFYFANPGFDLHVDLRVFRIEVDVRWNWIAARNIGMHHANTTWCLMTDIDHLIPAETFMDVMNTPRPESCAYKFSRKEFVLTKAGETSFRDINPHANTWLMTNALFEFVGGYDERFSGYYGTDGEFKRRIERYCGSVIVLQAFVIRVNRDVIPDADTRAYERKTRDDAINVKRINAEIANNPGGIKRLGYPYHEVC